VSDIADFLRARYTEARKREEGVRRMKIPGPFDGHDVAVDSDGHVFIDGHEYPTEKYREIATEPGADPFVLADLDAKLAVVDLCATLLYDDEGGTDPCAEGTLRLLAQPFVAHPDHKGEEWAP
jgi:hypothetical protein